jgi:molecular chaperone GrpE
MARKKLKDQAKNKDTKKKMKEAKNINIEDLDAKESTSQEETQAETEEQAETPKEENAEDQALMWKDKYFRTMAEFENYRRRTLKEKSDWLKNSNEKIMLSICDIMDNFDRAMEQMQEEHSDDPFIKGIVQIKKQMDSLLEKENVKKIETEDADFDPARHEALAHIPSELEENAIVAVIQNGYTMNDKIIRAARVAVSNGVKPEPKEENNNN